MKIRTLLLGILLMSSSYLIGQADNITAVASVNRDSILVGNTLSLTITVEGSEINDISLDLPDNLQVINGPQQSTQMVMVNGDVSRTTSYTYVILPSEIGSDIIPPILVTTTDGAFDTEPIQIDIYPNPTDIKQEESLKSPFSSQLQLNFDEFFGEDFQSLFDQRWMDQFDGKQPQEQVAPEENTSKRKLKRI